MSSELSTRDALTSRILPQMTLSNAENPLTAPLPDLHNFSLTPADRAARRFAVEGNAIITGGAGTLALETARALLEHGAAGLSLFDLEATINSSDVQIDALRAEFPAAHIITKVVDVTDEQAVQRAVSATALELGSVDMLLCFAGVVACAHAFEIPSAAWRRTLDVNTTGSWLCAQAAARQMAAQRTRGSIVFVASVSAHRVSFPQPQAAYNASKGALLQLARSLAAEWAHCGVRVNSVSPGYMDTVLNAGAGLAAARGVWAARNPMGRMGEPGELVGAVVLLCSRAGAYVNGADIVVDGGATVF